MTLAQQNTDLSLGYLVPGVFVQLNTTGTGAALGNPQLRALLIAYKTTAGIAAQDSPILCTGQSDANLKAGQGSELARLYAAFISQIGGGQCDTFLLPIVQPAAGTAATRTLTFSVSSGSNAGAQDSIELWLAGYHISTLVNNADTMTTIATNVAATVNNVKDIPWTAGSSSGVVTLTYRHTSASGEDAPIMAFAPNNAASNLQIAHGTITYATNASGAGTATVTVGSSTVSATINNSDTPSTVATNVAAAINATNFPVTATAVSAVVTLYSRNDISAQSRVIQRPAAAIVTSTGITATVASGVTGLGAPNLTNALAVLAAQGQFGTWCTSFNDTASLGSMSSHIETYANGLYQKDQFLWACSTGSLTTAAAIPTGTTPALTASGRYHIDWCPDAPVQAYELAARHAAFVCVQTAVYPAYNYDGTPLVSGTATVPLLLPDRAVRPSIDSINSAMSADYLTPLAVNEQTGQLTIVRGRNTLISSDLRQWDTSLLQCMAFTRYNVRIMFRTKFPNKSTKSVGQPFTTNTITVQNLADAVYELLLALDGADIIDGASALKASILANINIVNPGRADVTVPVRYPVPLHQIAPVVALQ